jgi:tetratricopeptide (TPR) repeat protein
MRKIAPLAIGLLVMACNNNTDQSTQQKPGAAKVETLTPEMEEAKMQLHKIDSMIRRDSNSAGAWFERGGNLLLLKDTPAAMSSFLRSNSIEPLDAEQLERIGYTMAESRDERVFAVAQKLQRGSSMSGAKGYFFEGIYCANIGDHNKAVVYFDSAIVMDYTFPDAHVEKGVSLYKLNQHKEALEALQKLAQTNSTNADAYYWMGKCYEAIDNKAEAKSNYERAMKLDGKFTAAKEAFEKL